MAPPRLTGRAGVTLNEILFAIMVMGVGLLSVASLFPIGLLNVARAVQLSRAGGYADATLQDLANRRLLAEERYRFGPAPGPLNPDARFNNPFIADHGAVMSSTGNFNEFLTVGAPAFDAYAHSGERGLPVAIDPHWLRRVVFPATVGTTLVPVPVAPANRLGSWPQGVSPPTNWGVQRVLSTDGINNNFAPERLVDAFDSDVNGVADAYPDAYDPTTQQFTNVNEKELYLPDALAQRIFASRDDIAFQETEETDLTTLGDEAEVEKQWLPLYGPPLSGAFAAALPFGSYGEPMREQKYSSLVTAYLPDAGDPTRYEVSQAVFFNRDFLPTGERTVLAYYLPQPGQGAGNLTIPVQPSNQVVLMWPINEPAPEVPREGWFLDASYDANASRWTGPPLGNGPGRQFWPHRAFWYRIVDRGEPRLAYADGNPYLINGQPAVRQLITLDRPVREVTYLLTGGGVPPTPVTYRFSPTDPNFSPMDANPPDPLALPRAVNVAVIFPGLVSVYERTLTVPKP